MRARVDRISGSGNAIAYLISPKRHEGKIVHVPGGEVGSLYDVMGLQQCQGFLLAVDPEPAEGDEEDEPSLVGATSRRAKKGAAEAVRRARRKRNRKKSQSESLAKIAANAGETKQRQKEYGTSKSTNPGMEKGSKNHLLKGLR